MLTSSFFCYAANVASLRYFLSKLFRSYLSATFFALTICSLSLNSLVICACRVLSVSEGSTTKYSYAAPSCSRSFTLGCCILMGITVTNLCQFPSGSITALGVVDGVATCGAWLISVFSFVSYVSIICLSTSYVVVIAVIGSNIVS